MATQQRKVALTFDDGPSASTVEVAAVLERNAFRGTFFVCGANVTRFPGIVRTLHEGGHAIGNHTYSHRQLYFCSASQIRHELRATQKVLAPILGSNPQLFRPPFGSRWLQLPEAEAEFGLTRITWSEDGRDWKLKPCAIARRVLATVGPGSIICLHDGRGLEARPDIRHTIEAVRIIIETLSTQGYSFVTVPELLASSTAFDRRPPFGKLQ